MGSETQLKLAIIDFSKLDKPGSPLWESVRAQVREAVEDFGAFEAVFDKVPLELREAICPMLEAIFDLPLETKRLNASDKGHAGYIYVPSMPLHESLRLDFPDDPANTEKFINTLWPQQGKQNYSQILHSFAKCISELDQMVRRMILESYGVEKHVEEHLQSTDYRLRIQNYKAPNTTETELGLIAHTDMNSATTLYQDHVKGLQLRTKDGEWFTPEPSPDRFIFLIGETITVWTNGRAQACHHRVMMSGQEARYSMGLFSLSKPGYIVKVPEVLIDEEHPLLYKPFDYSEFLKFYVSERAKNSMPSLKEYCDLLPYKFCSSLGGQN